MRVLVTGASETLAPFVIRALWERHEVVPMSRRPPQAECATLPWVQRDIIVFADCQRAVQGIDAIQHLAAQPWPVDHPRLRQRSAHRPGASNWHSRPQRRSTRCSGSAAPVGALADLGKAPMHGWRKGCVTNRSPRCG